MKKFIKGASSGAVSLLIKYLLMIKLILVFVFAFSLQSFSHTYGQNKIIVKFQNVQLKKALKIIEQQGTFRFVYKDDILPKDKLVNIDVKNADVEDVLEMLLQNTSLTYKKLNENLIVITEDLANGNSTVPLVLRVSGKVTNEKGEPLAGATVTEKGVNNATTTKADGTFEINVTNENAVLTITYVGYVSMEVEVKGQSNLNIQLTSQSAALGEVIVVAYGSTTKKTTTGAIQTVDSKELQDIPVPQVTQKLQGKLAGVQINQTTGKPGQGMQVRIRGQVSILAGSDPLYVVDGFPIVGDISNINPDEIETISGLKDAASTSLYGSRAANGVVLITTKHAKGGETNVGINAFYGVQQVPQKGRPDMMNGAEFAEFKKESYEDLGLPVPEPFQNPQQYSEGYNWYDGMLQSAPIQNYSISLNSSKDRFSTSAVAGFFKQDGVLRNSDYTRFSLRVNSEFKVSEKIKTGFNIAPIYSIDNTPSSDGAFYASFLDASAGGILYNSLLVWPILPYKNNDGSLPLTAFIPDVSAFATPNYYRALNEVTNETKTSRLISNAFVEYAPIKGLSLKSTINADIGSSAFLNFKPSTASVTFVTPPPSPATSIRRND